MKRFSKQLLSALLAVMMVITIMPVSLFTIPAAAVTYKTGDIRIFGSYPQSQVTDPSILADLNAAVLGADNTVTLDGTKYLKASFSQYTAWDSTSPKTYEYSFQDDNGYLINTIYWFKFEPIQWRVLSNVNGQVFVMSVKILDSRAYNQTDKDVTWATSTLRTWLNSTFYNTAFSPAEKAQISTANVITPNNPDTSMIGGVTTADKLFLISYQDSLKSAYGFSTDYKNTNLARRTQGTDYSKYQGLNVNPDAPYAGSSIWWMRTPGANQDSACRVYFDGTSDDYNITCDAADYGVRPAFKFTIPVTSITFSKSSASLATGATLKLTPAILPTNATNKAVTWTTSNAAFATVSTTGAVTGKSVGSTTITCTAKDGSGVMKTFKINVVPATPGSFAAVKASSTSVKVSWGAVSAVNGYEVYRATSSTATPTLLKTTTAVSITDKGLTKNHKYYYKVRAFKTVSGVIVYGSFTAVKSVTPS